MVSAKRLRKMIRFEKVKKRLGMGWAQSRLSGRRVETTKGAVEGFGLRVGDGLCEVFLGIPYAEPPVGQLRFKKPVPARAWSGVKDCCEFGDRAVQVDLPWDQLFLPNKMSEDCLTLNVFSPQFNSQKKYPVMFFIHGGGFLMDTAAKYQPADICKQFVSREIVVVTIQYRLGYLGWLSLGNEACKGNFGLWDQTMALQWTRENISAFGGDPERITVCGHSAGAISADLLSLSPHSNHLFSQKILLGGNAFCHWAIAKPSRIVEYSRHKAEKLGWNHNKEDFDSELEESMALIDFLRDIPAHRFASTMVGNREVFENCRLPLAPYVDGNFLPASLDLLRERAPPIPTLAGAGVEESLLFISIGFIRPGEKFLRKMERDIARESQGRASLKEVSEYVKDTYGDAREDVNQICVTMLSDIVANYAQQRYAQYSASVPSPTYMFSLEHSSSRVFGFVSMMMPYIAGTHGSDLIYLFNCNYFYSPLPWSSADHFMADLLPQLATNFIKTGNPNCEKSREITGEWEAVPQRSGMRNGQIGHDVDIEDPYWVMALSEKPLMKKGVFGDRIGKLNAFIDRFDLYDCFHTTKPPRMSSRATRAARSAVNA